MTPVDQEKAVGEEQAATLRGIFHALALAVLEVCDDLEREGSCAEQS